MVVLVLGCRDETFCTESCIMTVPSARLSVVSRRNLTLATQWRGSQVTFLAESRNLVESRNLAESRTFLRSLTQHRRSFSRLQTKIHRRREEFLIKNYPYAPSLQLKRKLKYPDSERQSANIDGAANIDDRGLPEVDPSEHDDPGRQHADHGIHDEGGDVLKSGMIHSVSGLRGSHGGFMRDPLSIGSYGKLDAPNTAVAQWKSAREEQVDDLFVESIRRKVARGTSNSQSFGGDVKADKFQVESNLSGPSKQPVGPLVDSVVRAPGSRDPSTGVLPEDSSHLNNVNAATDGLRAAAARHIESLLGPEEQDDDDDEGGVGHQDFDEDTCVPLRGSYLDAGAGLSSSGTLSQYVGHAKISGSTAKSMEKMEAEAEAERNDRAFAGDFLEEFAASLGQLPVDEETSQLARASRSKSSRFLAPKIFNLADSSVSSMTDANGRLASDYKIPGLSGATTATETEVTEQHGKGRKRSSRKEVREEDLAAQAISVQDRGGRLSSDSKTSPDSKTLPPASGNGDPQGAPIISDNVSDILDEHQRILESLQSGAPAADAFRTAHINKLVRRKDLNDPNFELGRRNLFQLGNYEIGGRGPMDIGGSLTPAESAAVAELEAGADEGMSELEGVFPASPQYCPRMNGPGESQNRLLSDQSNAESHATVDEVFGPSGASTTMNMGESSVSLDGRLVADGRTALISDSNTDDFATVADESSSTGAIGDSFATGRANASTGSAESSLDMIPGDHGGGDVVEIRRLSPHVVADKARDTSITAEGDGAFLEVTPASESVAMIDDSAAMIQYEEGIDPERPPVPYSPFQRLRATPLNDLLASYGGEADWGNVNECVCPTAFIREEPYNSSSSDDASSTAENAKVGSEFTNDRLLDMPISVTETVLRARTDGAFFDTSFRRLLRMSGRDCTVVADHFLTCNMKKMRTGDARYL